MGGVTDDQLRFERLYRAHSFAVFTYARGRVGPNSAEDAAAETFAVAWRKLDSVPEPALPWLLATARRVSANMLRAQRKDLHRHVELTDFAAGRPDFSPEVNLRRDLVAGLKALPPLDREALILITWYDLSYAEAASIMDCSTTAFGVRVHRAKRRLRRLLELPLFADQPTFTLTETRP